MIAIIVTSIWLLGIPIVLTAVVSILHAWDEHLWRQDQRRLALIAAVEASWEMEWPIDREYA